MSIDVAALRAGALARFKTHALALFAANPGLQSLVLGVAQFWADEADDAVHEELVAFPTREPWWPHACGGDDGPGDGARCSRCSDGNVEGELYRGFLHSNASAVFGWSAFCAEHVANQDGDASQFDPVAIARRGPEDTVALELCFELVRPWLDRNDVGERRDERERDWGDNTPSPEPTRAPWSARESELLRAVLAHPNVLAPRHVLVDLWLEANDVRGEFGALSFEPPKSSALREKRDTLAAAHGRAWLGPLQPAISIAGAHFARGPFVSRATVCFRDEAAIAQTREVEEWALLEALRFVGERQAFSPHMRGLKEVTGLRVEGLRSLAKVGLKAPIEVLGVTEELDDSLWCAALAHVHTLRFEDDAEVPELSKLSRFERLRAIEVWHRTDGSPLERWQDERAEQTLSWLAPRLPTGLSLTVGYAFQNGARGGVVARTVGGSSTVDFEDRAFSSAAEREDARARVAGLLDET